MKKKKSEMYRNEIKSYIVRAGMTMSEVVDYLADDVGLDLVSIHFRFFLLHIHISSILFCS